jgi:hypothetical protein
MDKFSEEDESCMVVSTASAEDSHDEPESLRADFFVAVELLALAELGVQGLLENRDPDIVYTRNEVPISDI